MEHEPFNVGQLTTHAAGSVTFALNAAAASVTNNGTIAIGRTTFNVTGNYTQSASGTLALVIAGLSDHGHLVVGNTATVDGTMRVTYDGYTLVREDQFELITAATVNGVFAVESLGGIQGLAIGRLYYEGGRVLLRVLAAGDFDGDGFVTGIDYDIFVQAFEAGDLRVDVDGDGFITGADFDIFVVAFEQG